MSTVPLLTITETEPTPLLKDFVTFIHHFIEHPVSLTRINEFIPRKVLYELNQRMTHPVSNTTPLTDQNFYPLLHLFYHLALAGKLFRKVSEKGDKLVWRPTGRIQLYEELKPAEKYFFLLETLWIDANWKNLQAGTLRQSPFYTVPLILWFMSEQKPSEEIPLKEGGEQAINLSHIFWTWEYFLLYFSYFGLWKVIPDEEAPIQFGSKRDFKAKSIIPSTFGVTIAPILNEARELPQWNLPSRREAGEWKTIPGSPLPRGSPYKFLRKELKLGKTRAVVKVDRGKPGDPFFLPFVPLFADGELQRTLPREGVRFVDGIYVFKVALAKDLWRRIEISADDTLLSLHRAIQEAYHFDDDHLYSFFMDGKRWSRERFTSPLEDEGPHVDEARIGELGLYVGQNILYLFDYGDEWKFRVELEETRTEGTKPSKPKIVEKKGKAPKQYRY
jgi:hypothetical protein